MAREGRKEGRGIKKGTWKHADEGREGPREQLRFVRALACGESSEKGDAREKLGRKKG